MKSFNPKHLEVKLNLALKKSGLSVEEFAQHIISTRPNTVRVEYDDDIYDKDEVEIAVFMDNSSVYNQESKLKDWYDYFSFYFDKDSKQFECNEMRREDGLDTFDHHGTPWLQDMYDAQMYARH